MKQMIPQALTKSLLIILGGAVGGFGAVLATSGDMSVGATNQPYQIPYQGHLERGGVPEDGNFNFVFRLYDAASDPDPATPEDESLVWESSTRNLFVSDGNFSVILGDSTDVNNDDPNNAYDGPIEEFVMAKSELYVGIEVAGTALSGRQKLVASPSSQRGASNNDFVIDGTGFVADLEVTGSTSLSTLSASGATDLNGSLNVDGYTHLDGLNVAGNTVLDDVTADGRLNVVNDYLRTENTGHMQTARVNFGQVPQARQLYLFKTDPGLLGTVGDDAYLEYERLASSRSTLRMGIGNEHNDRIALYQDGDDRLVVDEGNVNVNGDLDVSGKIQGELGDSTCEWAETGLGIDADNQMHEVECPSGRYAAGFRCRVTEWLDGDCAIKCCTP